MPFTVSHIAAVLPARGLSRLPLAGLAVGAMSPDLEYLFQTGTRRTISHSPSGIILLDLPLALLALALAGLAAPGLAALVPGRWPNVAAWLREWRPPWGSPSAAAWLVVAIIVGAMNHIVVDEFTHRGGLGTQLFPVLDRNIRVAEVILPLYRWMQYGLSVLWLGVLIALVFQWWRRVQPPVALSEPWIEGRKLFALTLLGSLTALAAVAQTIDANDSPGLNKTTAVLLILGSWRAGTVLLVGMGTAARGLRLISAR